MRISERFTQHGVRNGAIAMAAVAMSALAGAGISTTAVAAPPPSVGAPGASTRPAGSSLQIPNGGSNNQAQCAITSTGTPVGGVKHVWLIILENKSYDETFTGLNQNSYLWQTLPQQGRS